MGSKKVKEEPVKFTVEQIVNSKRFKDKQDLVHAVTVAGETYTMEEVEDKIQNYMKGKVE